MGSSMYRASIIDNLPYPVGHRPRVEVDRVCGNGPQTQDSVTGVQTVAGATALEVVMAVVQLLRDLKICVHEILLSAGCTGLTLQTLHQLCCGEMR
jgi:hypothetical protein